MSANGAQIKAIMQQVRRVLSRAVGNVYITDKGNNRVRAHRPESAGDASRAPAGRQAGHPPPAGDQCGAVAAASRGPWLRSTWLRCQYPKSVCH
jgi:hypothetical protein